MTVRLNIYAKRILLTYIEHMCLIKVILNIALFVMLHVQRKPKK